MTGSSLPNRNKEEVHRLEEQGKRQEEATAAQQRHQAYAMAQVITEAT